MRDSEKTFAARIACGLYGLAGFVGASLVAAGVLQFPEAASAALALILFGSALAAAAWHRGRIVLERADHTATGEVRKSPKTHARRGIAAAARSS
jgi:heme A synthase